MTLERLQKVLAAAGVGSRRKCEDLIAAGRVQVNGKIVQTLGVKVDPARDRIVVDGATVKPASTHRYYKVHKPRGVLSDAPAAEGERRTVLDLAPPDAGRLFPVGRLDLHSEGLVLLTDDGELAHRLTHPRYEHPKTYYVLVEAIGGDDKLDRQRFEEVLERAARNGLFEDAVLARTTQQRVDLWRIREDSEQIERQYHPSFGFDVSLPLSAMEAYVARVRLGIEQRFGKEARCWIYGHLGDGNLHINLWAPSLQPEDVDAAAQLVYAPLSAFGGSISAEHGIGLEKKKYLPLSRSPQEIQIMQRLKRAFDPHNILNPGRVFDLDAEDDR
jgi:16S rRNA U516 pseudouridylate synthase RsuA-like enzyme